MTRRILVVAMGLLLAASACSLGPKEDWANAMRDAHLVAAKAGAAHVDVAVATKVVETTIRQTPEPLFTALAGRVDFAHRAAKLVVSAPKSRAKSTIYFHDLVSFMPRSKASMGRSAKHWARFSFESKPDPDIDANDRRDAIGAIIAPSLAVELLEGVLAGSIKNVGTTNGVTEYSVKVAPDAAVRDLRDEERVKGILRVFETYGIKQDVFPARVWVDDGGRIRRVIYSLRQEKDRVNVFATTIDYRFAGFAPASVTLPDRSDSVTPKRFTDFVGEYIREGVI